MSTQCDPPFHDYIALGTEPSRTASGRWTPTPSLPGDSGAVPTLGGEPCQVLCSLQPSGTKTSHHRGLLATVHLLTSGTRDSCRDRLTQTRSRAKQTLIPARL